MNIRVMTPDDYAAVYALWTGTPGVGLNGLDDSEAGIAKFLQRNPTTCFVAEENGIAGVILCGHDGRRGYIYHMSVAEHCRRKGIGSALLDAAVAALQAEGIIKAALVVFADNQTGNQFWESKGFTLREDILYRNKALTEIPYLNS